MANRFRWLCLALTCVPAVLVSCGGDTAGDATGSGGSGGSAGASTGGSAGLDGSVGTGGSSGTGGTAGAPRPTDGGRIPCGDAGLCPPGGNNNGNQTRRLCDAPRNRCVQCLAESDCAGAMNTPHCDVTAGTCRPCVVGNAALGCPTGQICVAGNNMNTSCQPTCAADTDCAMNMNNRACNTTTMLCVQCNTSANCATNMNQPVCNVMTHNCEQCIADTDCATRATTPFCRAQNNQCVACRTVADCPAGATGCGGNGNCQMPQAPRDGGMMTPAEGGGPRPMQDARPEAAAARPEASVPVVAIDAAAE
jgi:hypothetical protein